MGDGVRRTNQKRKGGTKTIFSASFLHSPNNKTALRPGALVSFLILCSIQVRAENCRDRMRCRVERGRQGWTVK